MTVAIVAVAAGAFGYDYWRETRARGPFEMLLQSGQGTLEQVRTSRSRGQTHLRAGEPYRYGTNFPTSGPHAPVPTVPGFYASPQRAEQLVHALEHGHVVVYYDAPGDETIDTLKDWTRLFGGRWDGLIVAPHRGLGQKVVMTAWRKRLDLESFDPPTAARFIDAYRGRGPERPVR